MMLPPVKIIRYHMATVYIGENVCYFCGASLTAISALKCKYKRRKNIRFICGDCSVQRRLKHLAWWRTYNDSDTRRAAHRLVRLKNPEKYRDIDKLNNAKPERKKRKRGQNFRAYHRHKDFIYARKRMVDYAIISAVTTAIGFTSNPITALRKQLKHK